LAYIGTKPTIGNFQICDAISVVNGQAAYTMQVGSVNVIPQSANHMIVSLNGTIQKPNSSFTVSGSTITFASNLATGDVIDFIQILGDVLDLGVPSDATVTTAKVVDGAITSAKLASGVGGVAGITSSADATAMTIDSSENVSIGTTVAVSTLNVLADSSSEAIGVIGRSSDDRSRINLNSNDGSTTFSQLEYNGTTVELKAVANVPLVFRTNNTERMRINNAGKIFTNQTAQFHNCVTIGGSPFTGDFQIEVSGLLAVNGGSWKQIGMRLSYAGIQDDAGGAQTKDVLITIRGLSSYSSVTGVDTGGGTVGITLNSSTTTASTFTITSPSSTCVGAYVVTLFANDNSTMECNA
jgi:hypothetical protein